MLNADGEKGNEGKWPKTVRMIDPSFLEERKGRSKLEVANT